MNLLYNSQKERHTVTVSNFQIFLKKKIKKYDNQCVNPMNFKHLLQYDFPAFIASLLTTSDNLIDKIT